MASSNQVQVALVEESVYGETPAVGDFETARFTSESLSGTPETTESQQIRTDRLSSGQVVTGLEVGGDLNFELAKEDTLDLLMESAFLSSFQTSSAVSADLEIDTTAKTLTRLSGDFNNDVEVGDFITLAGFTNTVNNTQVQVATINSATEIGIVFPEDVVDETETGTSFTVADKMSVGTTKKSFSMIKSFEDLSDKAINYRGMLVSDMNLSVTYGEIVTGSFTFSGNDYEPVDVAADFMTDGRTVNAPATTQSMNGSIDMPFVSSDNVGTLDGVDFCIQSVEITLSNNLTAQTCIGKAAPNDYSPGTAQFEVSLTAYFANENFNILEKKQTQESFALGFQIKNGDGWYGFYIPALQVSFDDPASGGANQDVFLNMTGQAKVGANGESSVFVYRG